MSNDDELVVSSTEEEDTDGGKTRVSEDFTQRRLDALSKSLWSICLVLLIYAFFCFLSLAQPDASFLKPDGTIKMPFANVDVGYRAFFIFGPIALAGILFYLHILLGEWAKFGSINYDHQLIYLFNIPSPVPRLVTTFTFYLLGPIVLLGFAFKARVWTTAWFWFLIAYFVSMPLLTLYLRRKAARRWTIVLACVTLTAFFGGVGATRVLVLLVPFQIAGADLSKQDFRGVDLRGINASFANLSSSSLEHIDLSRADFSNANLEGARLSYSRLVETNLRFANLGGAQLIATNLQGAELWTARLTNADLFDAILKDANLSDALLEGANLSGANLSGARLERANLSGANLSGAWLESANLREANLTGAVLKGANLSGANLSGARLERANLSNASLGKVIGLSEFQLTDACGNDNTQLPWDWSIASCDR